MKKILIIICIAALPLMAQSAGKTGMSFLKMGFGARMISLGDAGSVFSNDISSLHYNPAHLAGSTGTEILVMHNQWIQDVRSEVFGARFQVFGHPFAIGINTTSVGDIEVRTKPGEPDALISANYFSGSVSTGISLSDHLAAGATVRYLYEGILADEATGFGFDLGVSYRINQAILLGASVRNLGSMNKLRNESTKLPSEVRAGASYLLSTPWEKLEMALGAEFQKYLQQDDFHLNGGAEIIYDKLFALRLGYMTQYEARSFTGGIGLYWGIIKFDYAISPFSNNLGTAHSVSVSLTL